MNAGTKGARRLPILKPYMIGMVITRLHRCTSGKRTSFHVCNHGPTHGCSVPSTHSASLESPPESNMYPATANFVNRGCSMHTQTHTHTHTHTHSTADCKTLRALNSLT